MSDNDTIPKKSTSQINKAVFFTSALLIFLLVAFAAVFPDVADKNFKLLQQQIFTNASWFYILAVALIWHCCKVSDEAAFCLIQRPYISKTLLT
ncbi:BCCT family transporter, partial [Klebsiella pneumoniae]|nr:BCCT family transporter [Klebsiella pneumoniae]